MIETTAQRRNEHRRHRLRIRDTHGASIVGFAVTQLLGYKLPPRLKNMRAAYPPREARPDSKAAQPRQAWESTRARST